MKLADPSRSRVLLVGTATYQDRELVNLPAVRNNIADLAAILTDPNRGGLEPSSCHTFVDVTLADFPKIDKIANEADDVLLIYFAGHGLLTDAGKLLLAMTDTERNYPYTALQMDHLRTVLVNSMATIRVLILDCCYSERALRQLAGTMAGRPEEQMEVEGTYTLASAPANQPAIAPKGTRHTAFTGELITLLQNGIAGDAEFISMNAVFRYLSRRLASKGLPSPKQFHSGTASSLALVQNVGFRLRPEGQTTSGAAAPRGWVELRRTVLDARQDLNSRVDAIDKLVGLAHDNRDVAEELKSLAANATLPILMRMRCVYEAGRLLGDNDASSLLDTIAGVGRGRRAWTRLRRFVELLGSDHRLMAEMSPDWAVDHLLTGERDPDSGAERGQSADELWGLLTAMMLAEGGLRMNQRVRAATQLGELGRVSQARTVLLGMLRDRRLDTRGRERVDKALASLT